MTKHNEHYETMLVHGDHTLDAQTGSVAPPIYMTSTFAFRNAQEGADLFAGKKEGYIYTRLSNPTIDMINNRIAQMEGAEKGLSFASGMAAISTTILTICNAGDEFISHQAVYGGTFALFTHILPRVNVKCITVDATNPENVIKAITPKTKAIYIETPSNPTMAVIDIKVMSDIAKKHNLKLIVDNTFMTPYLQQPIEFGADISLHSASKYLGGHGDIIGGMIAGDSELIGEIHHTLLDMGSCISPFNAWIIYRGMKTLHIRMERHSYNALKIAEFLEKHPAVERVCYPGLPSHPQYEIAKKQQKSGGGMVTFEVKGGKEAGRIVMDSVHICVLAVSLGDIDTLIQHPASMTHSTYSDEELAEVGITPGMVRVSAGIEHYEDIIDDLDRALTLSQK